MIKGAFATVLAWAMASMLAGGSPPPSRAPVLVELFTSEGCSSCPAAEALLTQLLSGQPVAGAEVIPLEFHVDYWDRLGWKDPFSSAAFTRRQGTYTAAFQTDGNYTPQMVVDGAAQLVGSDRVKALDAIARAGSAAHLPLGITARLRGAGRVRVSVDAPAAPSGAEPIDILVVLAEDGLTSAVTRGENKGRTLAHTGVVRRHEAIGALDRDAFVAEGEWPLNAVWTASRIRAVAFLQGHKTHRVYGAASAPVQ
jgi:hypothetical protein